jgi:hypothetical protein
MLALTLLTRTGPAGRNGASALLLRATKTRLGLRGTRSERDGLGPRSRLTSRSGTSRSGRSGSGRSRDGDGGNRNGGRRKRQGRGTRTLPRTIDGLGLRSNTPGSRSRLGTRHGRRRPGARGPGRSRARGGQGQTDGYRKRRGRRQRRRRGGKRNPTRETLPDRHPRGQPV